MGCTFRLGILFVFAYSSAVADTPVLSSKDGKWCASANAGLMLLNDIDWGADLSFAGVTATATGSSSFDSTVSYDGAIGYVVSNSVRTEFELGYQKIDHDKIKGSGTLTAFGTNYTLSGEADVRGDVSALHGLANVILTPFGNKTLFWMPFTPIVGAGIGFVDWEDEIKSIGTLTVTGK